MRITTDQNGHSFLVDNGVHKRSEACGEGALVPLRFESGTRFKVLEAGACRIPVVSTSLGAEGLAVTNGHNIPIADKPKAFADSVVRLIQDRTLSARVGTSLKQLVLERYSIAALVEQARAA